jgi:uncharacterized protein YjiS (DUF1127 family)
MPSQWTARLKPKWRDIMTHISATQSKSHRPALQVSAIVAGARAWLANYVSQRRALRDLSRMSDHELRDIGITRSDIAFAVRDDRWDNRP